MIAGETESILSRSTGLDQYDNFLFFGKKKNGKPKKVKKELSPEEQEARRARRQRFWSTLGSSLKEGGTVSNVLEMFKGNANPSSQSVPEDYQINIGDDDSTVATKEKEEDNKEEKGIPTPVLIIGGLLGLSVVYLAYQNYLSSQESKRLQS